MTEMTPHKQRYSRVDLLKNAALGYITGVMIGVAEAVVGTVAIPTSIRRVNDSLDENIDVIFNDKTFPNGVEITVSDKVRNAVYHSTRLIGRVGSHGAVMYAMVEDIIGGGNINVAELGLENPAFQKGMEDIINSENLSYGDLLAVPTAISAGYELYRFVKRKYNSKQVE